MNYSIVDSLNPKDAVGSSKIALSKFPAVAQAHAAHAMMWGAYKAGVDGNGYGPHNWRSAPVRASVYVDAALRHLLAWYEGEDRAPDSGCHHLGHLLAGIGILIDAQACGTLVDDRPICGKPQLRCD
jgi:dATP/dGTP diphosphohydrolase, N-terminal